MKVTTTLVTKLGHNDHSYNEYRDITSKVCKIIWSTKLLYYINLHGYNDVTVITNNY